MTERLRGLVEEFNRWRRFWWRAIKNGMKPGASLVNWVLALVTLVGLLFSVQLTVASHMRCKSGRAKVPVGQSTRRL